MIEELNLELDINKFELLWEEEEDSVTDLIKGIKLQATKLPNIFIKQSTTKEEQLMS